MLSVVGRGSVFWNHGGLLKVQQTLPAQPSPSQRGSFRYIEITDSWWVTNLAKVVVTNEWWRWGRTTAGTVGHTCCSGKCPDVLSRASMSDTHSFCIYLVNVSRRKKSFWKAYSVSNYPSTNLTVRIVCLGCCWILQSHTYMEMEDRLYFVRTFLLGWR